MATQIKEIKKKPCSSSFSSCMNHVRSVTIQIYMALLGDCICSFYKHSSKCMTAASIRAHPVIVTFCSSRDTTAESMFFTARRWKVLWFLIMEDKLLDTNMIRQLRLHKEKPASCRCFTLAIKMTKRHKHTNLDLQCLSQFRFCNLHNLSNVVVIVRMIVFVSQLSSKSSLERIPSKTVCYQPWYRSQHGQQVSCWVELWFGCYWGLTQNYTQSTGVMVMFPPWPCLPLTMALSHHDIPII